MLSLVVNSEECHLIVLSFSMDSFAAWQQNVPSLYDFIAVYELPAASMTVQWSTFVERTQTAASQKLLLGAGLPEKLNPTISKATHKSPPSRNVESKSPQPASRGRGKSRGGAKSRGSKLAPIDDEASKILSLIANGKSEENKNVKREEVESMEVDVRNENLFLFQFSQSTNAGRHLNTNNNGDGSKPGKLVSLRPDGAIAHPSSVLRARFMPQDRHVIAARSLVNSDGYSDIVVYRNHTETQEKSAFQSDCVLRHHKKKGCGLSWNDNRKGELVSASNDGAVCIWSLEDGGRKKDGFLAPLRIYTDCHSEEKVLDVAWHPDHNNYFGSVGDDTSLMVWDTRGKGDKPINELVKVHGKQAVNCISWNRRNEWILATAGDDGNIFIHDLRALRIPPLLELNSACPITALQWSPFSDSILASGGEDGRIMLWDLSIAGASPSPLVQEEGPSQLLFIHGGHKGAVNDISWNSRDDWMIASVATGDESVQIWKMNSLLRSAKK